jgi:enamine deaminase RidA (YjgF/YER057c/UK114 family)
MGKAGLDLSTEEARDAARGIAVDLLGTLQATAENLDRIRRIVKVMVLVNSAPGFTEAHLVADSVMEVFMAVFVPLVAPAGTAFGVTQLPLGACVEVDLVAEVI